MKHIEGHRIIGVKEGSIAHELGIEAGDWLLRVDGELLQDVFDYQYRMQSEWVTLLVRKENDEEWELEIEKEEDEDPGLLFETGLMDGYKRCINGCIFCFVDQLPQGMREALYFKDDDSRLSFLQGNYITLTNLSDADVERIIAYRLSPIQISIHTMDPQLRCTMLRNPHAGEALAIMNRFLEAKIPMNGQIVLCKGINDGDHLEHTIRELTRFYPVMGSVSIVPVGLTRFREKLYPLSPFTKEDAQKVLTIIGKWQEQMREAAGSTFVHAADEWYLLAEEPVPTQESYDGYPQLENGVGMIRLLMEECKEALEEETASSVESPAPKTISLATGVSAYPTIQALARHIQ
ncbi:MAG: DUF512 domain-containing protein, partial [Lachnospiraceae bacterium]|nr:DUF512 domain-containing protein [Lachnospiraceae bacterium]